MATWIDLSAHNLALWRIGEDRDGIRVYALLPVFSNIQHTQPNPDGPIGSRFAWNPDIGGYVLPLRYAEEKLPNRAFWLEEFPGALFRDRDATTFPIHQPSFLTVHSLALKHPWVWSNRERPERFYANEEQALADDVGPAVLRAPEEVDMRGVREIPFPVDFGEEAVEAEEAVEPEPVATEPVATESVAMEPASQAEPVATSDEGPEPDAGKRTDYGEFIPGARKSLWEDVQSSIEQQSKQLETTGHLDIDALMSLAGKARRDAVWGTLKERLEQPDVAKSPLKQALWRWVYRETPASVKSTYWKKSKRGNKNQNIPPENLYLRILAYPEILRSIERKIDAIEENVSDRFTAEQLANVLAGDFRKGPAEGIENYAYYSDLYPTGPYQPVPDSLRGALNLFPVSTKWYAETLDHPSFGLCHLVSALKKDSFPTMLRDSARFLTSYRKDELSEADKESFDRALRNRFAQMVPDIAKEKLLRDLSYFRESVDRFHKSGGDLSYFTMSRINKALGGSCEDILKSGDEEKVNDLLEQYAKAALPEMLKTLANTAESTYFTNEAMVDILYKTDTDPFAYAKESNAHYRADRDAQRDLAAKVLEKTVDQIRMVTEMLSQSDSPQQEEQDVSAEGEAAQDETPEAPKEPEFVRWNPGEKPLPPEHTEEEGYRKGPPSPRGDRDVTEAELCERFGLRAIQYGNWMTQKDRQEHLNAAYDGLHDIQSLMGLDDPKAVGLPRKVSGSEERQPLALALGARGRGGRFAAHYESSLHVINMTKTRGAGSLLHEWGHAADWFMGAEHTQGAISPASKLPGTALSEHVKVLKSAVAEENESDRVRAIVEKTRPKIVDIVTKAMISKEIQQEVKSSLWYYFIQASQSNENTVFGEETLRIREGKMREEDRTVTTEMLNAKREAGIEKANQVFSDALPKMVRGMNRLMDRLDQALTAPERTTRDLGKVSEEILVHPVYQYSGSWSMRLNEQSATNWIRELLDLPGFQSEEERKEARSRFHEKNESLSDDEVVAFAWKDAILSKFWKRMASRIVNDNPYENTRKEMNGLSRFYSNAMTLDGKKLEKGDPYWSSEVEIFARNLASIGYDKLKEKGIENTYLTDSVPHRYSHPGYRADPDPQDKERETFAKDFFEQTLPHLQKMALESAAEHYAERLPNEEAASLAAETQEAVAARQPERADV